MTRQRIGTQAIDLFSATVPSKNDLTSTPRQKRTSTVKSTVTLYSQHIYWLDRLSSDIRAYNGTIIDRGAIIRAMVTALENSGIDLSQCLSEEHITDIILSKIKL